MAKARPELPALSEAQLEIMDCVWQGGEVTVTDVWNVLAGRRPLARNTVLTLMDRLEKTGWLRRRAALASALWLAALAGTWMVPALVLLGPRLPWRVGVLSLADAAPTQLAERPVAGEPQTPPVPADAPAVGSGVDLPRSAEPSRQS